MALKPVKVWRCKANTIIVSVKQTNIAQNCVRLMILRAVVYWSPILEVRRASLVLGS